MTIIEAIILGVVQGLTEFIPVSSSGHLIIARELFGLPGTGLAFDAVLQLATALAAALYFRRDLARMVRAIASFVTRAPVPREDQILAIVVTLGTVPAVLFGLMAEQAMETAFRNTALVAGALVAGSTLMAFAEYTYRGGTQSIRPRHALPLGFFQSLALIPGVSRSGATIAGGMLLGLTREDAMRASFLLSVPLLLGSGAKKALELASSTDPVMPVVAGSAAAFVVGLAAIRFLMSYLTMRGLMPFVIYRLALAVLIFSTLS
jgi:undecaprenyl-diphosphatase